MKKQVIKLKKVDLNQAIIRGLKRSIWEKKKTFPAKGKTHLNPKLKSSRYKKTPELLDEEF